MKPVHITIETTFEVNTKDEQKMVFFTEAEMEKHKYSYTYTYKEYLTENEAPVTGQIEIGPDFVVRSIHEDDHYIMNFKEGLRELMDYPTPAGFITTKLETKRVELNMDAGLGKAMILYSMSLGDLESALNQVTITITEPVKKENEALC
ncbi:YwiB family protein [Guggenheimella bovis]